MGIKIFELTQLLFPAIDNKIIVIQYKMHRKPKYLVNINNFQRSCFMNIAYP